LFLAEALLGFGYLLFTLAQKLTPVSHKLVLEPYSLLSKFVFVVSVRVHSSNPIILFMPLFSALESAPGAVGFVGLSVEVCY